jgi:hypothetical protein
VAHFRSSRLLLSCFCLLAVLVIPASSPLLAQSPSKTRLKAISFDDVKFAMKKKASFKRSLLTKEIVDLDGQLIKIRGYILPSFQQKGITRFVLVRDNMECCFGPGAALYDCIVVDMESGKSTSFTVRPITVEGIFTVREYKGPNGKHLAIYHLKGRSAQ